MLRAGLVGLGAMGRHHAKVLQSLDGVTLVAAADPRGDVHAALHGVPIVPTLDDLLAFRLDYCVVATPPSTHAPIGLGLAAASVHALIEKPLATTAADAALLATAFDEAGLVGAVAHTERYHPATISLRDRIANGDLGELYQVTTTRHGPIPARADDIGVALDLATHDFDLATWIAGTAITRVAAFTLSPRGHRHEDLLVAVGQLSNGAVTSHTTNWLSPTKERRIVALGQRGRLVADTLRATLTVDIGRSRSIVRRLSERTRAERGLRTSKEPLVAEHLAFRDELCGQANDSVTFWSGYRAVAAAEAALSSARGGAVVSLQAPPTSTEHRQSRDQTRATTAY